MARHALVLNAGSSSIKFALFRFDADGRERDLVRGAVDGLPAAPRFRETDAERGTTACELPAGADGGFEDALRFLTARIDRRLDDEAVAVVGHRVVHGGETFTAPVRIDAAALDKLHALAPLAPLHQPQNLAPVAILERLFPGVPQVACFDTAFHATLAPEARLLPVPKAWTERGIRRFGFHGLSYEYVADRLRSVAPDLAAGRTIVAHLGSGASLCLLEGGRSAATSMGFSALDGLMMGTRSGALDPGVIFHRLREGAGAEDLERELYTRSGLLGVSGLSGDMRQLRRAAETSEDARRAIALFTRTLIGEIGRMIAWAGGAEGLVFTAGIGENDAALRADVLRAFAWAGFPPLAEIAEDRDAAASGGARTGPRALVLRTDEERMIARHAFAALANA